jgi:sugar/nucleoside kinase (ribokinase family)
MHDIVSIGDAVLDTFIEVEDAFVTHITNRKVEQLCLNFGDKIPVKSMVQKVAGNALNNAVGSARLGMKAAFYSVVGDDDVGEQIERKMKKEGITTKYLHVQKGSNTNYSVVLDFQNDRTILQYSYPRTYRLPRGMGPTKWVYYTALGKNHRMLEKELIRYASGCRAKIAFNPGGSQLKEGVGKMKDLLRHTEAIFVNREEAEKLVGDSTDVPGLLYRLHELGPHIAVITDGRHGAYASNSVNVYHLPIFPAKFVEATGAGDAFATGFVAALHHGENVPDAMRWGTANSAGAISQIGPQDGLLTLPELRETLKRYSRIKAKVIGNSKSHTA